MTYWTLSGKYQSAVENLQRLVPESGNCGTVEIEAFRAATRIYHELNNNGFKFNNWSGPLNYIYSLAIPGMQEHLDAIKEYRFGEIGYDFRNGSKDDLVLVSTEKMVDLTIEWILGREAKNNGFEVSTVDMWSFQEPEPIVEEFFEEDIKECFEEEDLDES